MHGSFLKDRRLELFVGEPYKQYESQVPGYPLMTYGPLARKVWPGASPSEDLMQASPTEERSEETIQAAAAEGSATIAS